MTESTHVGPIIFADPTAREQLEEHGEVVTFRSSQRTTGETWWRESRTGPKEGDVRVEEIGECDPYHIDELEPYRELSGFETVVDWQEAICNLNGDLGEGYLYRAEAMDGGEGMTVRWPKTSHIKIHEGCGGIVAWKEAIGRTGVHFTGVCNHCDEENIVMESIIPIETNNSREYRYRIREMAVVERAALEWDDDNEFRENQKRLAMVIEGE